MSIKETRQHLYQKQLWIREGIAAEQTSFSISPQKISQPHK